MSLFQSVAMARIRRNGGAYVKGSWQNGVETSLDFKGTFQPASGRDIQLLPEGIRNNATFKVFAPTSIDFLVTDSEAQVLGDIIVAPAGRRYEVVNVAPWFNGILPHYELLVQAVKEGQS